jgi:predicted transposase/invertase (TIGR01784 family)
MVFTKNGAALKGLLSTLLNIPESQIIKIEILNPMQYSDINNSKLTVLDMKVHLNDQKYILVEMQVRKFENWTNRTVVYTCRQVADQANGDFDYGKLEPVVQISIMDYTLFQDNRVFFDQYLPRNEKGYPYTDKIQFYVMDLTAMDEATDEQKNQGLVEWAKAFKAESWEEVREIDNPAVKEGEALTTASGGNFVRAEVIRNKRSALWAVA